MEKNQKSKKISWKKVFIGLWLGIIILYVIVIFLNKQIETYITFPYTIYQKITRTQPFYLTTKNWKKIYAVYLDKKTDKTIFYFHGNGENLQLIKNDLQYISDNFNVNVLCFDYPWYSQSEWIAYYTEISKISEIFYDYLIKEKGIKKQNIILRGYSIWWAVAIDLASKVEFSKLIITSSFTSRYDMGKSIIWFVAQRLLLLPNSFISQEKIKNIKVPTLIMHGNQDKLIPFFMGQKLFENSWSTQKTFVEINKSWHNWIISNYWEELKYIIKDFLDDKYQNNQKLKIWQ